ncbi:hypothetical protein ABFU82_22455 [Nocardioides sp. WV_118_6]
MSAMGSCDAELCPHWTGHGCICDVMGLERIKWCRDCRHATDDHDLAGDCTLCSECTGDPDAEVPVDPPLGLSPAAVSAVSAAAASLGEQGAGHLPPLPAVDWSVSKPGEAITLGFDGSRSRDRTTLTATRISDGRVFHLRLGLPALVRREPPGPPPLSVDGHEYRRRRRRRRG